LSGKPMWKMKAFAVFAVLVMAFSAIPSIGSDTDADVAIGEDYTYAVTYAINTSGASAISQVVATSPSGTVTLNPGTTAYSKYWEFGADGIGPFNSFYATFTDQGELYELLNPNNLEVKIAEWTINGWEYDIEKWAEESKASHITTCNTMWVLPTIYLKVDPTTAGAAVLTFSNKSFTDATAYAHTYNGKVYPYIAIGVYEAYLDASENKLKSISGVTPTNSKSKEIYRSAATNTYSIHDGQTSMMWNYYQWSMYLFCAYTVTGTMDFKNTYSYPTNVMKTGQTNQKGAYTPSSGNASSSCFIENMQGSLWELLEDVSFTNGNLYVGQNTINFNDNTADKDFVGTYYIGRQFVKTFDFTKSVLGMPGTYTNTRAQSTFTDNYIANATNKQMMVGGGYGTDASRVNVSTYYNTQLGTGGSGDTGTRLAYVFDTSTSGSDGGISWSIDNTGVLSIWSTDGTDVAIPDYGKSGPWGAFNATITEIHLSSNINRIGENAFNGLMRVEEIKQNGSSNLTILKYGSNCFLLKGSTYPHIKIPDATDNIGVGAFVGVDLEFAPSTAKYSYADPLLFDNTGALIYIRPNYEGSIDPTTVPKASDVENIDAYTGYNISASSVNFPNLKTMGEYAFANSKIGSLNSSTVGTANLTGIDTINDGILQGCLNINTVLLNDTTKHTVAGIGPFKGMTNLTTMGTASGYVSGVVDVRQFTVPTTMNVVFDQSLDKVNIDKDTVLRFTFNGVVNEMHVLGNVQVTYYTPATFVNVKNLFFEDGEQVFDSNASMGSNNILETAYISNIYDGDFKGFFRNCPELTTVKVPGVKNLVDSAFSQCKKLRSFNSDTDTIELGNLKIPYYAFYYCESITEVNGITDTISSTYAFYNCIKLAKVNLPNVTNVPERTFMYNYELAEVNLHSATVLGVCALYHCDALKICDFSSVETLNNNALSYCLVITSFDMPKVETVGDYVFQGCVELTTCNMPEVTSLGIYAFNNCTKLKTCIFSKLEYIGNYAFAYLKNLDTIKRDADGPTGYIDISGVTTISTYAFRETNINNVLLNKDVSLIGECQFSYCYKLTTMKVTDDYTKLDNDIVDISGLTSKYFGTITFYGSNIMTHVKLGDVRTEGQRNYGFFEGCSKLKIVEINETWKGQFPGCTFNGVTLEFFGSNYDGTKGIVDLRGLEYMAADRALANVGNFTKVIVSEASLKHEVNLGLNRFNKMKTLEIVNLSDVNDTLFTEMFASPNTFNNSVSSVDLILNGIESGDILGLGYLKDRVKTVTVTGLNGESKDSYLIGDEVFNGCTKLTEVRGSFNSLGYAAFCECSALTTLGLSTDEVGTVNLTNVSEIPDRCFESCTSIKKLVGAAPTGIGQHAFYNCISLTAKIGTDIILDQCKKYDIEAFCGVTGLKGDLVFNKDVSKLGTRAFSGTSITSVSVKDGSSMQKIQQKIQPEVFKSCKSLVSVKIDGVNTVSSNAFNGCMKLKLIVLPMATSFDTGCFKGCSMVSYLTTDDYNGESNGLFISNDIQELFSELGTDSFPNLEEIKGFNKVDTIYENMFIDARKLTTISGFDKLTVLPDRTFSGCVSLTAMNIPGIETIGDEVFKGCTSFEEISNNPTSNVIMTNVTTLGNSVFDGCTMLSKAILSDSIVSIGTYMFNGCVSLDVIKFPANLETIPSYTFSGCENLLHSASGLLTLPNGVKIIDQHAFEGCNTIKKIVFSEYLEQIRDYAFYGCPFAFRDSANTFTVPDTVTTIGDHAFDGCTSLYTLDMGSSMVIEIGDYAFNECGIRTVTFSPVLQSIGAYAFYKCTSLDTANLPSSLKLIGEYAFANCRLTSVAVPDRVTDITNSFRNNKSLTYVCLSKNLIKGADAFRMDDGSAHTNTVKVYVNSSTWSGSAPFTSNDNLEIHSVLGSWEVRQTWFPGQTTGDIKSSYETVTIPLTPDELWYGGFSSPIQAIQGSKVVLPSIKAVQDTAEEQKYLFAYGEGSLKVGYSDDTIIVYGSMVLSSVENAGQMTIHYTSGNPSVTLLSPTDRDYSYGESFYLEKGVASEAGVNFAMWQCVLEDGYTVVEYNEGDLFVVWRPISEMRAIWTSQEYKLTLYYYRGSELEKFPADQVPIQKTNPMIFEFGEDIVGLPYIDDPSDFGYENYQFKGWYTGPNGTGTKYEDGMPMPTKDMGLIAYFTPNPHYVDIYLSPSSPTIAKTITVYGDTTITAIEKDNNLIKYTDSNNPVQVTMIDASDYDSMKGLYISEWRLNTATGIEMTEGSKITSDINRIYAISDDIEYRLYYDFRDVGVATNPPIEGEVELNGVKLHTGDYTKLEYGDFVEDVEDYRYDLGQPKTKGFGFVEWKNMKYKTVTYVVEANFVYTPLLGEYVFSYTVTGNFNGSNYTVSYDKNYKGADNTSLIDPRSYDKDKSNIITLPTSTVVKRAGYDFMGWTWNADGTGEVLEGGSQQIITTEFAKAHADENMVFRFYAKWEAKSYNIKYNVNGGDEIDGKTGGADKAQPDKMFDLSSFTVKKNDGYRFIGWCIDPEGQGSKVYPDGSAGIVVTSAEISEFVGETSKDITFYAIWKKISYTIKFDLKGGTSTVPLTIEDVKVDEEFALLAEGTYTSKFKTLKYWHILDNTSEGSSFSSTVKTVKLTRGMASMATQDENNANIVTVYAIWSDNRYTVRYDLTLDGKISGGASIFPIDLNSDGYAIGDVFEYPAGSETYVLEGYVFKGWSPIAIGDTRAYEDGTFTATFASTTSDYVVTFYAVWEKETYILKFDLQGGIPTNTPNTYTDTLTYISYPIKEGAEFIGWTVSENYDGLGPNALQDLEGTGNYMAWTGKQSLATNFMNLQTAGKTVELVANWKSKEYTLAYSINGGSGDIKYDTIRASIGGAKFDLPSVDNAYKEGYTLVGWALKDGTYLGGVSTESKKIWIDFTQNMVSTSDDDETVWIYAQWKAIKYSVRYYSDETTPIYSTVSISYDEPLALDEPVRAGWEFTGWKANLSGTTPQYSRNGIIWYAWDYTVEAAMGPYFKNLTSRDGGTVELFGTWERTLYDVGYNFNGGTSGKIDGQTTGRVGEPFTFNSSGGSEKKGYTFGGWSLDGVTVISGEGKFTEMMSSYADVNDLVTLYAVWNPITYEVEYRYDDTAEYTAISAMYDVQFALESLQRTGYTFMGWKSSDVDYSIAKYSIYGDYWIQWAQSVDYVRGPYFLNLTSQAGNTVHLDAVWEVIEYKVEYNSNGGTGQAPKDESTYTIGSTFKLQPYTSLIGTNGNKNIIGWSTNPEAKVAASYELFTESLALTSDLSHTVTFYAIWVEGQYRIYVDVGDATVSSTPIGWVKGDDGRYSRSVEYGTSTTQALEAWNSVSVTKEGYLFTGWHYDYSTVITEMTITPIFEKVMQELLYYCIGIIVLIIIAALVITRFERR